MSAVEDSCQTFSTFEEKSMCKRSIFTNEKHSEHVFYRYSLLREKNILTDAVISSNDGQRFHVHRFIMAGASEYYFDALLNADEHEKLAALSLDINSEALETIITFCYSGGVELTVDNVGHVMIGAEKLRIDSLGQLCSKMLDESLNINTCIRFLEIADKHEFEVLREKALAVILDVFPNVSKLPEFFHLTDQQTVWLLSLLLTDQDEMFCSLLDSLIDIENSFPALNLTSDAQSISRASFIAGFLIRNQFSPARTSVLQQPQNNEVDKSESGCESGSDIEFVTEEQLSLVHVLAILRRNTIQFRQLCTTQRKWIKSSETIQLSQAIESYRDAMLIPFGSQMVILHMQNGWIYRAECLVYERLALENIALPHNVECALFCHMNDTIYCFERSDQQNFFGFDLKSKAWSRNHIENVKVAKCIVGLNGELYFLGCGFNRSLVRSYHLERKEWTDRGNLRYDSKATCFKGIVLKDSIYVVMSRYDSEKIYNGTEFIIQRFDENVEDWIIVKRIFYSHYVSQFNLAAAENCLYLFYGDDGEVQIYNEDHNEWNRGPAIEYGLLNVSLCMMVVKSELKASSLASAKYKSQSDNACGHHLKLK